jgi:predicted glycogen debranching enzyme
MYNTIDGTLWLFVAVYQYLEQTDDQTFVTSIYPTLERIIKKHIEGTVYNIHVGTDGLLSGGDKTTQLTWMDVKIDGVVVTPRHGKAVEINALWYNSLMIMNDISKNLGQAETVDYLKHAALCKTGFKKFWNKNDDCLFDLIQDNQPINHIRPNQIFAVSLPFSLLSKEKELAVIKKVEEELLTPFGLRSLSKDHIDYKPIYNGDVYQRDYAYHQGTVWGWLIGPYLEAHYKLHNNKEYIQQKLQGLFTHLDDTGIGSISEVFSGNEPHHARGCFGQAWSVSETLRVYKMIK